MPVFRNKRGTPAFGQNAEIVGRERIEGAQNRGTIGHSNSEKYFSFSQRPLDAWTLGLFDLAMAGGRKPTHQTHRFRTSVFGFRHSAFGFATVHPWFNS